MNLRSQTPRILEMTHLKSARTCRFEALRSARYVGASDQGLAFQRASPCARANCEKRACGPQLSRDVIMHDHIHSKRTERYGNDYNSRLGPMSSFISCSNG